MAKTMVMYKSKLMVPPTLNLYETLRNFDSFLLLDF
jgi:hypothetical protein